jgi:hypothetical protein
MSDELDLAIKTAQRAHDRATGPADGTAVTLGALIRAVALLARREDARVPANECSNAERAQYEATIEQQKQRIAELEKQVARSAKPTAYEIICAWHGYPTTDHDGQFEKAHKDRAKRIFALFNGQETAKALRRVRERIGAIPLVNWKDHVADAVRIIDEELAKVTQ